MDVDPRDDFARLEPYLPEVAEAARPFGVDLALVCAVGLRESAFGWAWGYRPLGSPDGTGDWVGRTGSWLTRPGVRVVQELPVGWARPRDREGKVRPPPYAIPVDGLGWGRGIWQLDSLGDFAHLYRPAPWPIAGQVQAACELLVLARRQLGDFATHPLFERAVVARYNARLDRIVGALQAGLDPDSVTTPGPRLLNGPGRGDYGADVLSRAVELAHRRPFTFSPPAELRYPPTPPPDRENWP